MLSSRDVPSNLRRLLPPARTSTADPAGQPRAARQRDGTGRSVVVPALIALVVMLDQSAKWWAWRHVPWTKINAGGDILVGSRIGAWYAAPVTGALLDRLGTHYWTAPGSVRGVVDFIHIGGHYYNVADFFIIGCTPLFLLAAGYQGVRATRRPAAAGSVPPPARRRARVRARLRIPAL